jgi:hypothetical protein
MMDNKFKAERHARRNADDLKDNFFKDRSKEGVRAGIP